MTKTISVQCIDEEAMRALGERLVTSLVPGTLLTLEGELGAGKSFLARAMIHAAGYVGRVKSPTYTLIETYHIKNPANALSHIAHLDLYRLADPEELYYLGFDEVLESHDLVMIEWPVRAGTQLPDVAVKVSIVYATDGQGRVVTIESNETLALA